MDFFSLRILPHDQDTGCFFVAVLKKVAQHPWVSSNIDNGLTKIEKKKEKRRKVQGYREDPFVFFSGDEEIWKSIEWVKFALTTVLVFFLMLFCYNLW